MLNLFISQGYDSYQFLFVPPRKCVYTQNKRTYSVEVLLLLITASIFLELVVGRLIKKVG